MIIGLGAILRDLELDIDHHAKITFGPKSFAGIHFPPNVTFHVVVRDEDKLVSGPMCKDGKTVEVGLAIFEVLFDGVFVFVCQWLKER